MRAVSARLVVGRLREVSTIGVVGALAAAYATVLYGTADTLDRLGAESGGSVGLLLKIVAPVFIGIALFVSAIVIGNGVDTVIAGRTRQLELLRLIGASSAQLRGGIVAAVARVSVLGAGAGLLLGTVLNALTRAVLRRRELIPESHYEVLPGGALIAVPVVVAVAVAAAAVGTRRTLGSSAALRGAAPVPSRLRAAVAAVLIGAGALTLATAAYLGERGSLAGFFTAFLGSVLVGIGVMAGARLILPRLVAGFARTAGSGPAALVARKNALSDPARTARSAISLLIGVTLITTVASGMNALGRSMRSWEGLSPDDVRQADQVYSTTSAVLIAMIAISALIAAVGFVSTMSLTVIARTREIGMLRAMGFTARQVRSMIGLESLALSGTAVTLGLVLGVLFGAVGSQSLLGSQTSGPVIGLPWATLGVIAAATGLLVLVAALPPSRRAVAVAPTAALATP
ncbi:MAG: FtsX-like permease family protein [Gordonia sp. (in: high G+C Gram-positive bacteria)]|uniref:ABC transporter permease n=1 Tax=Gordonia sp. (in: high G+C Gram-positive bacteria) TaxID=84139 RepID=UPI0039E36999